MKKMQFQGQAATHTAILISIKLEIHDPPMSVSSVKELDSSTLKNRSLQNLKI